MPWHRVRPDIEAARAAPGRRLPSPVLLSVARLGPIPKDRHAGRAACGTTSLRSSSCFPYISAERADKPVMFPPGRARLAMNWLATGSLSLVMTMELVTVVALAHGVDAGLAVTITSTLRRTSSAASEGRRSSRPSADRHSMRDGLSLHVPQLAQALPECLDAGRHHRRGDSRKESYPWDARWLLRVGGERRGEEEPGSV